jgi:hypothetical protein
MTNLFLRDSRAGAPRCRAAPGRGRSRGGGETPKSPRRGIAAAAATLSPPMRDSGMDGAAPPGTRGGYAQILAARARRDAPACGRQAALREAVPAPFAPAREPLLPRVVAPPRWRRGWLLLPALGLAAALVALAWPRVPLETSARWAPTLAVAPAPHAMPAALPEAPAASAPPRRPLPAPAGVAGGAAALAGRAGAPSPEIGPPPSPEIGSASSPGISPPPATGPVLPPAPAVLSRPAAPAREPAPRAAAAAPDPHCRSILLRAQLGEEPTDADRRLLRQGCAPMR